MTASRISSLNLAFSRISQIELKAFQFHRVMGRRVRRISQIELKEELLDPVWQVLPDPGISQIELKVMLCLAMVWARAAAAASRISQIELKV